MSRYIRPELKHNLNHVIRALGVAASVLTSVAAFAVTAPYSDNFDSYPIGSMPDNFTIQTSGGGVFYEADWSVQNPTGNAGVYRDDASGDTVRTSAALEVTNLAQRDFVLSTTFVVNSYGSFAQMYTDIHVGLNALAPASDQLSSGYQLSYELLQKGYDFPATGALAIYEAGHATALSSTTLPVATGITYTMTLTGTYSPNGLLLTGTLSDGTNSISVTYNDLTPQQGTYFGYYDFASGLYNQGAYVHVDHDNFSIRGPGPNLVRAASVLTHKTAGTFAVEMPLTGSSGVEDRRATTYNAAFTFDAPVTSGQVTVLSGTATVGTISFSGNTLSAKLTGITAAEVVTLHLENINGDGQAHGDVPFGFLVGDVNANRRVGKRDLALVGDQLNQPVTSANFREDINATGRIRRPDSILIKGNEGHTIP